LSQSRASQFDSVKLSAPAIKKAKRALPSWKLSGYDVMFKLDLGHVFGVMSGECGTQQRKLLARLQSPKSLGSLLHRGSCPAQCQRAAQ
jgi:hypothetical protein